LISRYDLVLGRLLLPQGIWLGMVCTASGPAWHGPTLFALVDVREAAVMSSIRAGTAPHEGRRRAFIVNSKLVKKQAMKDYGVPAERISPSIRDRWSLP
jgi:hypothetical protein